MTLRAGRNFRCFHKTYSLGRFLALLPHWHSCQEPRQKSWLHERAAQRCLVLVDRIHRWWARSLPSHKRCGRQMHRTGAQAGESAPSPCLNQIPANRTPTHPFISSFHVMCENNFHLFVKEYAQMPYATCSWKHVMQSHLTVKLQNVSEKLDVNNGPLYWTFMQKTLNWCRKTPSIWILVCKDKFTSHSCP